MGLLKWEPKKSRFGNRKSAEAVVSQKNGGSITSQVERDLGCAHCGSQPGPKATEIDGQLMCDTCGARGPQRKFEWMKGQDTIRGRWNIRAT